MRSLALKTILAFALAAALISSCGCAWVGEALQSAANKPAADNDSSSTAAPAPSSSPDTARTGENPVFSVYFNFFKTFDECTGGLLDAVYESADASAARLLMKLLRDEADITLVYATVGMLLQDDDGSSFSGSFSGAFSGSGSLSQEGDFAYSFDSGSTLTGAVKDGTIDCTIRDKGEKVAMTFKRVGGDYIAWLERQDSVSVLEISDNGLRYAVIDPDKAKDLDRSSFPETEGAAALTYLRGELAITAAKS